MLNAQPPEPESLPFSLDSEKAFLCSLMIGGVELIDQCDTLALALFYVPAHQTMFRMLIEMRSAEQAIDFFLCKDWLKRNDLIEDIGGPEYLNELWQFLPTCENWEYYLDILKDRHLRRKTIQGCQNMIRKMYDVSYVAGGSIRDCAESTLSLMVTDIRPKAKDWTCIVEDTLEYLEKPSNDGMEGTLFDVAVIDNELRGIRRGEYGVICAEVSVGKTALMMQGALNTAMGGEAVAMFSFEMSAVRMAIRMISSLSKVSMRNMRTRLFSPEERKRLLTTADYLKKLKIRMEDGFDQDINGLINRCRQIHAKEPLALVCVDYLQLVTPGTGKKNDNREREVADISRKLKNLAVKLNVNVLALSQLNEGGKMRESRSISQDADIILKLEPVEGSETLRKVIIDKNRDGARGMSFEVTFEGPYVTFSDVPVEKPTLNGSRNGNGHKSYFAPNDR